MGEGALDLSEDERDELPEKLSRFEVLSEMSEEELQGFAAILQKKNSSSREKIIDENDTSLDMYFLLSGKVVINKVSSGGQIVRIAILDAKQNPFFGEAAILGFTSRSANVVADSQCRSLVLHKDKFDEFSKSYPKAAMSFYKKLAQGLFKRMSKADKDLMISGLCG